jgi:hypothetical protein
VDTAITALIIITLLLLVTLTISERYLSAQEAISKSWRGMEERMEEKIGTNPSPVDAETIAGGAIVEVTLRNEGDTKLADFDRWDVIIQYYDDLDEHYIKWLPYAQPGDRWVEIFPPEAQVFDPDILNPGEEMVIQISVLPSVREDSTKLVTIATPNGVTASTVFTR